MDADRVGTSAVDSLMEYLQFSRTSDFTPVGLTVVTASNVEDYRLRNAANEEGE